MHETLRCGRRERIEFLFDEGTFYSRGLGLRPLSSGLNPSGKIVSES